MKPSHSSHWLALPLALLLSCRVSSPAVESTEASEQQPANTESRATETRVELGVFAKQALTDSQKPAKFSTKGPSSQAWLSQLLRRQPEIYHIPLYRDHQAELRVLKQTDPLSEKYGLSLCWISFPIAYTLMVVKDVRKFGRAYDIFGDISEESDVVVVNGGFYGSNNEYGPLGLVISQGKVKNNRIGWKIGGVLFQSRDSIRIQPIRSFKQSPQIRNAIQCKPILVENGKIGVYYDDHKALNRVAVGLDRNNYVIVVGAFEDNETALSLYEFAEFLITDKSVGGPALEMALNLDGGPGAHMFFPVINRHFGYLGNNFVPNSIHFKKKR